MAKAIKRRRELFPDSVDFGLALGTAPVLEMVAPDGVPQPFDEQLPAGIAVSVLALLPRDIPHIDVTESGRQAPPDLVELADLVTEMRPVKHYYQAGVPARRGIEW